VKAGRDERGLFFERLSFAGEPDRACDRRVRVQGRQLFTMARAATASVPGAAEAVAHALPSIVRHAWGVDGSPGWIHLLAPDGTPRDLRRDTYDQSFLLFGLAAALHLGHEQALAAGETSWAFVDALRDRRHGGYLEGLPATLPRRSNPHMHLLEAALAWWEATGSDAYLDRANEIADLFSCRFLDRSTGTLGEFFDAALIRLEDERGGIVEPGHMFEWSWLLHRLAAVGGRDLRKEAGGLHAWAMSHARQHGFAVDELDRSGHIRRGTRRAWPQTELIKSALANGDMTTAEGTAEGFLGTYLGTEKRGLWIDQFDASGRPLASDVPASTLYHIVLAFEQLLGTA
jgi:mannose-6-phosphate isomerase